MTTDPTTPTPHPTEARDVAAVVEGVLAAHVLHFGYSPRHWSADCLGCSWSAQGTRPASDGPPKHRAHVAEQITAALGARDAEVRAEVERLRGERDYYSHGFTMQTLERASWQLRAEAAEARLAAVEVVCAQVEADDNEHLNTFGQHLPGSVVTVAEMIRAALAAHATPTAPTDGPQEPATGRAALGDGGDPEGPQIEDSKETA